MLVSRPIPNMKLYMIIGFSALVILALSLDVLFRVKDYQEFVLWWERVEGAEAPGLTEEEAFSTYLTSNLSLYFTNGIIPGIYTIHSYFTAKKRNLNGLFIFLWAVLLAGGFGFTLVEWNTGSVFYYLRLAGYLGLFITTMTLTTDSDGAVRD